MSDNSCIQCNSIVRPRQEALQCDGCQRWQHRICNTGKHCFIIIINYYFFSSITEHGSGLESAWSRSFPEQTWLKFGIGSRLLEVLYVKSNKKTQVPICLFEVPICLIEVPNCPGVDLSWYRNVSHRCRFVPVPKCLEFTVTWQNKTSRFHHYPCK